MYTYIHVYIYTYIHVYIYAYIYIGKHLSTFISSIYPRRDQARSSYLKPLYMCTLPYALCLCLVPIECIYPRCDQARSPDLCVSLYDSHVSS